ncbi:unnamed protein product [Pieris macdunnoughi]|nr:unnamed protein product [Pieris macdunnoughi]
MLDVKLAGIGVRLLSEPVLRPPLAASARGPRAPERSVEWGGLGSPDVSGPRDPGGPSDGSWATVTKGKKGKGKKGGPPAASILPPVSGGSGLVGRAVDHGVDHGIGWASGSRKKACQGAAFAHSAENCRSGPHAAERGREAGGHV